MILFITTAVKTSNPTSPRLIWPGREAENSRPSSAEIKNMWSYTSTSYILHNSVLRCVTEWRALCFSDVTQFLHDTFKQGYFCDARISP
jgi:hypothetical protein